MSCIPECAICFETAKVPVRLICFPCKTTPGRPSCHSLTRVCLLCARRYLELDKPRNQRAYTKRCLTCTSTVRPSTLNASKAYEKEFLLMRFDGEKGNEYECSYVPDGCTYRGTQLQLDVHMGTECLFRTMSCEFCKTYFVAHQQEQHLHQCTYCTTCKECGKRVGITKVEQHLKEVHQLVPCEDCHQYVKETDMERHRNELCEYRSLLCMLCMTSVPFCHWKLHLQSERLKLEKESSELAQRALMISRKMELLNRYTETSSSSSPPSR